MPPPVGAVSTANNAYAQDLSAWQDAFPASVATTSITLQDNAVVSTETKAYECGTDKEVDALVCKNGMADPNAGIIEINNHESAAEIARRTGQTNGWTLETFTKHWNVEHYTSKGLPVPPETPESKRQITAAFLQQQGSDSTRVLHNWNRMDGAARVGNAIAEATVHVAASFPLGGMFIDNPTLLAKGYLLSEVAPMLTSSGGPDGGMGTVVGIEAALAAPAFDRQAVSVPATQVAGRQAAALENRAVTQGEIQVSNKAAHRSPSVGQEPKVIVDPKAYQVAPGRDGQLRALGMDPAQTRTVAHIDDGMGSKFDVVSGPTRTATRSGELQSRQLANPAHPPAEPKVIADMETLHTTQSATFNAPPVNGKSQVRTITTFDGQPRYVSLGQSPSPDSAGVSHFKQRGELYEFAGVQERNVHLKPRPGTGQPPTPPLDQNWLIKGSGFTAPLGSGVQPPSCPLPEPFRVGIPDRVLNSPQEANAWLRSQGATPMTDGSPVYKANGYIEVPPPIPPKK